MSSGGPLPAWRDARRVLCVRLDAMGDVLMTTPALAALRAGGSHVTLLTSAAGARIARLVPEIDEVLTYEAPWMKGDARGAPSAPSGANGASPANGGRRVDLGRDAPGGPLRDEDLIRHLAAGGFDAAVVFTVYSQSAFPSILACFLAGIPLRLAHCRENPYRLLTDWVPDPEPRAIVRHEVRRQLDLVATVGFTIRDERLRLRVPEPARARVRRLLASADLPADRWVLVHPGGTAPSRRYPPEHFAAAARLLAREADLDIVLSGSVEEIPLVEDIRSRLRAPSRSFAGELDLAELAALVEAAPVLVANNSGPAHIAAAVGTPVVHLYALTNPQHTPWSVPNVVLSHDVPCRDCHRSVCPEGHHACLREVPPSRVLEATMELLARRNVLCV